MKWMTDTPVSLETTDSVDEVTSGQRRIRYVQLGDTQTLYKSELDTQLPIRDFQTVLN